MDSLQIPPSTSTVDVSIIDSTTWIADAPAHFAMKPVPPGLGRLSYPSYSFFLQHRDSGRRLLFDLGLRKDFINGFNPIFMPLILENTKLTVKHDVADLLTQHNIDLASIEAIIVSHHHFDHIGNPATFPNTTKLIVGPGFKNCEAQLWPGYPNNPDQIETASDAFTGRDVIELDFASALDIGPIRALDYFGDGSFYLLATPGHTFSHISALVRTTPTIRGAESTFILLGGDVVHHSTCIRPSAGLTLPMEVVGIEPERTTSAEVFRTVHRLADEDQSSATCAPAWRSTPFCLIDGPDDDPVLAQHTVDALIPFDGMDNILFVFAHDATLLNVLDFFPKTITHWREKGWKEKSQWLFLRDLQPIGMN